MSELVKPSHLERKAVVYVRQSTPHQVVSNQESLRLQYALRQRARELGWRDIDIDVIDVENNYEEPFEAFLESVGYRRSLYNGPRGSCDEIYYKKGKF